MNSGRIDWPIQGAHAPAPRRTRGLHGLLPALLLLLAMARPAQASTQWVHITPSPPWIAESAQGSLDCVVYHNKLWLMVKLNNFTNTASPYRECWNSADGIHWTRVCGQVPFTGAICNLVVFKDKIWAITPTSTIYNSGVWNSSDGLTWTKVGNPPIFWAEWHGAITFNNKLWLIDTSNNRRRGTWSSADGVVWTQQSTALPFPEKILHGYSTVVFNGKLWLMGGETSSSTAASSEVWNTADGKTWTQICGVTPWSSRYLCGVAAFANKLWVIGGTHSFTYLRDVWSSANGAQWSQETMSVPFPGSLAESFVIFQSSIWRIGNGFVSPSTGEVWALGPPKCPPLLQPYQDQVITEGPSYTSPPQSVVPGSLPATWTLLGGPAGMTANAQTGAVGWTKPLARTQPYGIRLRATNAYGSTDLSWNLQVNPQPPTVVRGPAITRDAMITLNWNAIPSVSGYTIQCDDAPDFATPVATLNASADTLQQAMPAPPNGKTYWYRVRGNKLASMTSLWSNTIACTRDTTVPIGTMTVAKAPTLPNKVWLKLSVVDPGLGATGLYVMRFCSDNINWSLWEPFQPSKALHVEQSGNVIVRAQVVDRAWNAINLSTSATILPAPRLYVDVRNTSGPWAGTQARPYRLIQQAINVASTGTIVTVAPGVYAENIEFMGRDLVLRSTAPQSQEVVKSTFIDGRAINSVVRFRGSESADCRLEGFTLRNGKNQFGGGICGNGTHATIQYNRITGNTAYSLVIQTSGTPPVSWYTYYYYSGYGGGIANCDGLIQNNIIAFNVAGDPSASTVSGSTERATGTFYYWDYRGGALYGCRGTIQNNTFFSNLTSVGGNYNQYPYPSIVGMSSNMIAGIFRNNIIWKTTLDPNLASQTSYCCIQGWTSGGLKNITSDPALVNPAAGDFHLLATSPCIDAGCRTDATPDFDGQPRGCKGSTQARGDGSAFDIGADEYTPATPAR